MRQKLYILLIFMFGFSCDLKAQNIHGIWEDTYLSPMTFSYYFDTLDSTFKSYYQDDTHGSFGKGNYQVKGNKINFQYDSIICNKPLVELLDNDLLVDSTSIAFFHYWGFPKRIDILEDTKILYSNWTTSSDSIIEDYLFIKIPKRLDSLEIVIYGRNGSVDKEIERFKIRLYHKPFCNLYFYPCSSWYAYEKPINTEIKIKWIKNDYFETLGKHKHGFKRIK